jgi:class 3 adenylate cyclase
VAGIAAPGEVLVSGTVYGTVVGSGLALDDRGMRELKGVPGKWPLFALRRQQESPAPRPAPETVPADAGVS